MIATTNIGGAGKWRDAYAEAFRSKRCVVLADNDKAGRDHAAAVALSLVGIAASVKVLQLPGLGEKQDISDWLDAGGTVEDLERLGREAPDHQPQSDAAPKKSRILSGADFIARHIPPVWLIDGIVQRSRLYACTSLTGHGKTAVWLFNACMVHAGRMIGQLDVFQGNVLFLAGENPADLEARMIGMARAFNQFNPGSAGTRTRAPTRTLWYGRRFDWRCVDFHSPDAAHLRRPTLGGVAATLTLKRHVSLQQADSRTAKSIKSRTSRPHQRA